MPGPNVSCLQFEVNEEYSLTPQRPSQYAMSLVFYKYVQR